MYKLHFPTHAKCFVQGTHHIALIYKTLNISLMPAAASLFHVLHTVHTQTRVHTVLLLLFHVWKRATAGGSC